MSHEIICLDCANRGAVNKVTAGLRCGCGSQNLDFWAATPHQRRIVAARNDFSLWMAGAADQKNGEEGPGSNEYAGNMPGANSMSNHEGRIICPVCHGSGKDIQDVADSCRECDGDGYVTPTTTPQSPQVAPHNYSPNTQTKHPYMNLPGDDLRPYVGRRRTAGAEEHQDLAWKRAKFGTALTSLGRAGYASHRTAMVTDHAFDDPEGWKMKEGGFQPVRHAIEGARAFANEKGLRDPHAHDFSRVMQSKDRVKAIADHYDNLPDNDPSAHPHFNAMRDEVHQQHEFATKRMGINYESVDHDPYPDVHSMVKDVNDNKRLKVMSTKVTGAHPFFSDDENDKFRFVHDLFGHAATGRNFDRHGEEAAYRAHAMMFSPHARPAMAAETRGQNSSLIRSGDFGPQKIGVLPRHLTDDADVDRRQGAKRRLAQLVARTNPGLTRREVEALVTDTMRRFPEVR